MKNPPNAQCVRLATTVLAATIFGTGARAHADSILIVSDAAVTTEGLGAFEGTIDYSFDGLLGSLIVSLANTTPETTGGFLTGFMFNIDGDVEAVLVDATGDLEFASGNGAPFGSFEAGAALGGKFLGGGSPVSGVSIGDLGVFTFQVTGADASMLTSSSFVDDRNGPGFIVRFKGMNGGSDKVGVVEAVVVPLPAPLALGCLGLLGVAIRSRRRNSAG